MLGAPRWLPVDPTLLAADWMTFYSAFIGHFTEIEYSAKGSFARERERAREKESEREREREGERERRNAREGESEKER